jgi:very-short-patch-repair endonuclease
MFCKICNKEFSNDKSGEGKFYTHLRFEHNISKKQYVILTEYDAAAPKCVCGCSEEAAWENRIGFREYAKGHRKFKHRVQQYIKQNGHPVCSFSGCSNETGFDRAEPRKYCSTICATADRSEMAQNRLVHQIEQYIKENGHPICSSPDCSNEAGFYKGKPNKYCSTSCSSREKWKDPVMREKIADGIRKSINNNPEELQRRSDFMKLKMKDPEYVNNVLSSLPQRFSKLHLKIREQLNLEQKGFIGEQIVGRYVVDELNEAAKTIIEINGDYIHANPLMYAENDIIRLPGNSYTAAEKWESDKRKLDELKSMGYNVIVIWESDNINNIEI